jgi:nitrate/TMAO reductase-like tetraheme cytochrome c subunit
VAELRVAHRIVEAVTLRLHIAIWITAALIGCAAPLFAQEPAASAPAPTNEDCQACHGDPSLTRANGTPVVVHPERFASSVHGPLNCVDCHADLASGVEFPHPEKLARVNCAACHAPAVEQYELGIHAQARQRDPGSRAATCVDCHGGNAHAIRPSSDPASSTHKLNIAKTCEVCHGNKAPVQLSGGRSGAVGELFNDSIHGQALQRKGLVVAPTCSDCHSHHAIVPKRLPDSPVFATNVPATCGKCHEGIRNEFSEGVHGAKLAGGNLEAPNCASCHTAHGIERTDTEQWQLAAIEQCGTCHRESLATYRDTLHGQVTALGFTPVAKCADCHAAHRIFPKEDPRSMVSTSNLQKTCGECHEGVNANFVQYNPHANKHDPSRLPLLYYSARFMDALLVFVFAFFGVHTLLWFSRGRPAMRTHTPPARPTLKAVGRPPSKPEHPESPEEGPRG